MTMPTKNTLRSHFRRWLREEVGIEALKVYAPFINDFSADHFLTWEEWEESKEQLREEGHTPELFKGAMEHAREVQERDWTAREYLQWIADGDPGDRAGIPGSFFEEYARHNLEEDWEKLGAIPMTVGRVLSMHMGIRNHFDTPGDLDAAPEMDMEEEFAI